MTYKWLAWAAVSRSWRPMGIACFEHLLTKSKVGQYAPSCATPSMPFTSHPNPPQGEALDAMLAC